MPERFHADLGGVVDLLSRHVYSSPRVYLRELLQNAVDAIHARALREPGFEGQVRIAVRAGGSGPSLAVSDDGIGLTAAEIDRFLTTIGRSSKRDELSFPRGDLLGQFGLGLLSCFLVSDEITVVTRSVTGAPAMRWTGRADGACTTEPLGRELDPGTSVYLSPRPGSEALLAPETVRSLARHYGDLLPYPVTLVDGGHRERLNGDGPPWRWRFDRPEQRREALLAYGRRLFGIEFLDVVPLRVPAAGLEGLAFVLPFPPSPASRPAHRVHLKRMLLSDQAGALLPEWAFFVRCVVDASELRPAASREALVEDELLELTRQALGEELQRWLVRLAATDPPRLARLLHVHQLAIKALAVHDRAFFAMMARWLPFETSMGPMTLPECQRREPVVRYTSTRDTFRQLSQIAAAQGMCIVNGGDAYDAELIELLPAILPGVRVQAVEPADLLPQLEGLEPARRAETDEFLHLARTTLRPFECDVELRRFEPSSVPALYANGDGLDVQRSLEVADELWSGVLGAIAQAAPVPGARLCLNHANPLVRRLLEVHDPVLVAAAVELLYVQALLLAHQPLQRRERALLSTALLGLLDWCLDPAVGGGLAG